MLQVLQFLAAFRATLFAGAAIYLNIAGHPARTLGDTRAAAVQWAFTYKRATVMQAPLAMISLIAGAAAWLFGASVGWLMGDLLIGAVV